MMKTLIPGENIFLPDDLFVLTIKSDKSFPLAFLAMDSQKNIVQTPGISYVRQDFGATITLTFSAITETCQKILIICEPQNLLYLTLQSSVFEASFSVRELCQTVILGECYRYQRKWKFRLSGQGYAMSLNALQKRLTEPETVFLTAEKPTFAFAKKNCQGEISINVRRSGDIRANRLARILSGNADFDISAQILFRNGALLTATLQQALPYARITPGKNGREGQWLTLDGSLFGEIVKVSLYMRCLGHVHSALLSFFMPCGKKLSAEYEHLSESQCIATITIENKSVMIEYIPAG